ACSYNIYRIWTAEDACGNITVHKQTITVEDTTAPTFNEELPANATVECDNIPQAETLTASDNCSDASVSFKEVISEGDGCNYNIYRIWTAEDACGNTSVHKQTIQVYDDVAPVFTSSLPAANITVSCDNIPDAEVLYAEDNCSEATVNLNEVISPINDCNYIIIRIWTAEDACGNSVSHKQSIIVQDNVAPVFTSDLPGDIVVSCDNIPEPELLYAEDNCSEASVSVKEIITGDEDSCDYNIYRIWTAEDACGNITVHKQIILVQPVGPTSAPETLHKDNVSFDIYPMPFDQDITLKYNFENTSSTVRIEFFDMKGSLIHTATDSNIYLNKETNINVDFLRGSGQMYLIRVTTDTGSEMKKIISVKR
ncbi:MAG: T9SS type A sorting domain-containing protein, partial [Flavobacteriaceae bacterium]|nr:T9SS type A sorting domain-containing protein [Flavobacteriaceae bacterium]